MPKSHTCTGTACTCYPKFKTSQTPAFDKGKGRLKKRKKRKPMTIINAGMP
jgi:hypothetical protein